MIRCFVKGAPDQLLARAATVLDADTDAVPVPVDGHLRELYLAENRRLGEQGLRVMATARRDFDPGTFDPGVELLPLVTVRADNSVTAADLVALCRPRPLSQVSGCARA